MADLKVLLVSEQVLMRQACELYPGEERCAEVLCTAAPGEKISIVLVKGDEKSHALYLFSSPNTLAKVVPVLDTTTLKADGKFRLISLVTLAFHTA